MQGGAQNSLPFQGVENDVWSTGNEFDRWQSRSNLPAEQSTIDSRCIFTRLNESAITSESILAD
jgi:hypothetical protein